jgi:hypothetical protein
MGRQQPSFHSSSASRNLKQQIFNSGGAVNWDCLYQRSAEFKIQSEDAAMK